MVDNFNEHTVSGVHRLFKSSREMYLNILAAAAARPVVGGGGGAPSKESPGAKSIPFLEPPGRLPFPRELGNHSGGNCLRRSW
jgi:hypothetical protein